MIEQLAKILNVSSDVLYFYAKRFLRTSGGMPTDREVEAAYKAFSARDRPSDGAAMLIEKAAGLVSGGTYAIN